MAGFINPLTIKENIRTIEHNIAQLEDTLLQEKKRLEQETRNYHDALLIKAEITWNKLQKDKDIKLMLQVFVDTYSKLSLHIICGTKWFVLYLEDSSVITPTNNYKIAGDCSLMRIDKDSNGFKTNETLPFCNLFTDSFTTVNTVFCKILLSRSL